MQTTQDLKVRQPRVAEEEVPVPGLDETISRIRTHLLGLQREDGHWCAELEGDTILESEYFLLLYALGERESERGRKLANYLRQRQSPDGGWAIYPDGPTDASASVKAYFVLELVGDDPSSPHMQRARRAILEAGGLEACNSFTKLYLSIFGQYSWEKAPAVPPELILLPNWFYFNIYEMSSWSRAIVIPLAMIWALKPSCRVPKSAGLEELRGGRAVEVRYPSFRHSFFAAFFRGVDRCIKLAERIGLLRLVRQRSLRLCETWVRQRLEKSGGLAAIFPSIMNTVLAFRQLGYAADDPLIVSQLGELEKLEIEEGETLRLQPCFSPVWDTALALGALVDSGVPATDPALQRAALWLLDREVKEAGDWRIKNPQGPVGGWYFEYANEFYPDCDDTAEVLSVLGHVRLVDKAAESRRQEVMARALAWQLSMQNKDGGWGAFDRECNKELLTLVPFADHNAMIDPSTSDITARSVEALRAHGFAVDHPAVERAVAFLVREQESDGSWYGRWGANYIYGTWLALCALRSVGQRACGEQSSVASRRGVDWLLRIQNEDGGWGESLRSYDDPSAKGQGESTASQTAWALLGLLAATDAEMPEAMEAIRRGVAYLQRKQCPDGTWQEEQWTGTGFPRVFYLRYHLYASYFPLQALATVRRALEARRGVERAA